MCGGKLAGRSDRGGVAAHMMGGGGLLGRLAAYRPRRVVVFDDRLDDLFAGFASLFLLPFFRSFLGHGKHLRCLNF